MVELVGEYGLHFEGIPGGIILLIMVDIGAGIHLIEFH